MLRSTIIRGVRVRLLTASLVIWGTAAPSWAADRWTNLTGTSTVSGEMIGLWNGRVLLQLDGGRRVSVRMEDLRADSRIQAEKRLAEIQQRLQQRREEIVQVAQEAEAPAPPDAAELPPAPDYAAPPPGEDLRTTLIAIRDQMLAGHVRILYDTLPASHQKQANEAVALALAKLHTPSFESVRTAIHSLADLIVSRQRWLLSHPRLAQLPAEQQQSLIAAADFIRTLTSDELLSLAVLRSRPFGETVAQIDAAISPHLYRALSAQSALTSTFLPDFEVAAGSDGVMVAKVVVPMAGPIESANFKQVEGRWITSADATAESNIWKDLRENLEPLPDESLQLPPAADAMLQQFATALAPLQQANTRQEFHRALDELLPQIVAIINQVSGYQPPRSPGSANPYDPSNMYSGESEMLYNSPPSTSAETMP